MSVFILLIYLVGLYIRPQDWWAPMLGFKFDDVVCSLALLMGLLLRGQQSRSIVAPQNIFIFFFLVLVLLSNVVNGQPAAGLEWFIFYLKRAVVFVMFLLLIDKPSQLRTVIWAAVLCTVFLAIQAIYQNSAGINIAGKELLSGRANWVGMWDGPNVLSLIMGMAVPFPLVRVFRPRNLAWFFHVILSSILIYAFYLTNSRAGFLSLLSVFFFMVVLRVRKSRRIWAALLVGAVLYTVIGSPIAPTRLKDMTTKEASNRDRIWAWEIGLNLLEEKPILGVGKGRFEEFSYRRLKAHNNYIQNFAEMGFTGFFVYMAIIFLSFKTLGAARAALIAKGKELELAELIFSLQISLAAFCLMTFFVTMELDVMYMWWGLCAAAYTMARRSVGPIPASLTGKDLGRICVAMVGILVAVWLIAVVEIV